MHAAYVFLVACLAYTSILKLKVARSSETSVNLTGLHNVTFNRALLFSRDFFACNESN
jgi:hypothetical protein